MALNQINSNALVKIKSQQFKVFYKALEEELEQDRLFCAAHKAFVTTILESFYESKYVLKLLRDELCTALNLEDERYAGENGWDLEGLSMFLKEAAGRAFQELSIGQVTE